MIPILALADRSEIGWGQIVAIALIASLGLAGLAALFAPSVRPASRPRAA